MKTKVNSKAKTIIVVVSVFLLLVMLVGVLMQLRSLMLVDTELDEFGGEWVLKEDFNSPSSTNTINGVVTTLDYGNVSTKVGSFSEGNGSFVYSIPANSAATEYGNDPYVNFDMGSSKVYLSDYSVYMMDFDISITEDSGCRLYFNIDYRNSSNTGLANHDAQLVYQNGVFYMNATKMTEVGKCDGNTFHVTYIVNHEKTFVYINGKLLAETARSYLDGAEFAQGFRMGMLHCINKSADFTVVLDNLIINKFAPDYNGAIQKLFSRPDVFLTDNTDTIFGGTFKWEEE